MNEVNSIIKIPFSTTKPLIRAFGCSAITIWLLNKVTSEVGINDITSLSYLQISFIALTFLCGLGAIVSIKTLFNKGPGLVIDNHGFQYGGGLAPNAFISWKNVSTLKTSYLGSILVILNNTEEFISKQNKLKQIAMRSFMNTYGTPILISSDILKIDFEEFYKLLSDKMVASRELAARL
jgi:hypothetical protein